MNKNSSELKDGICVYCRQLKSVTRIEVYDADGNMKAAYNVCGDPTCQDRSKKILEDYAKHGQRSR